MANKTGQRQIVLGLSVLLLCLSSAGFSRSALAEALRGYKRNGAFLRYEEKLSSELNGSLKKVNEQLNNQPHVMTGAAIK